MFDALEKEGDYKIGDEQASDKKAHDGKEGWYL